MMAAWRRSYHLVAVLAVLVFSLQGTAVAQRRHSHSSHSHSSGNSKQLKSKLKSIRSKKEQLRGQLVKTKHQAKVVTEDIHVVDARLERLSDELDRTSDRLGKNVSEQGKINARLAEAHKRMVTVKKQVASRLADMYMRRHSSYISALVGTRSMHDLLTRQRVLEAIARYDRDLFLEYRQLQAEIAEKKRRQDQLVAEIRDLRVSQTHQQASLKNTREEKHEILAGLKDKQAQLQKEIAQWDRDERSIESEIAAYARRVVRGPNGRSLPHFTGRFMRPANGPITSGFGMRFHPILHYSRPHNGIDFGAPYGSTIVAAADGQVISARYSSSFGNVIIIAHGGNVSTVYAHCSRLFVSTGQSVRRGQRIGAVGATGLAKGPHLHWEVHVGGHPVNPMGWL